MPTTSDGDAAPSQNDGCEEEDDAWFLESTRDMTARVGMHIRRDRRNGQRSMVYKRLLQLVWADQVERPLVPNVSFDLASLSDADARQLFRFDVAGVLALTSLFRLPAVIVLENRSRVPAVEAVAFLLYRLSYPRQLRDMMFRFGRDNTVLSRVFLFMIDWLVKRFRETIYCPKTTTKTRVHAYCRAVARVAATDNVFGFIDGTKIQICRLKSVIDRESGETVDVQRQCFSGHKRSHCLSFQAVTAPDGLCVHFWGPTEGCRHDSALLRMSGLIPFLASKPDVFGGKMMYGDPAYAVSDYVTSPRKGNQLSSEQIEFNKSMSSVRESVEWSFGRLKTDWAFIDYRCQMKIGLSPIANIVLVGMLLTNCHTCNMGGNQISEYFNMKPPSLQDLLED